MDEVIEMWRSAVKQGSKEAMFALGTVYSDGEGVPQSSKEAVRWFRKSADQGYAKAQCNLGNMYSNGEGVPQSFEEAVRWYRKAADQGDADAQYHLGYSYFNGEGVPRSSSEALKWYKKAAAQGTPQAIEALARMGSTNQASQCEPPPPKAAADLNVCADCGISGDSKGVKLNSCSQCKAVRYCGKACQLKHWKEGGHKKVCCIAQP